MYLWPYNPLPPKKQGGGGREVQIKENHNLEIDCRWVNIGWLWLRKMEDVDLYSKN